MGWCLTINCHFEWCVFERTLWLFLYSIYRLVHGSHNQRHCRLNPVEQLHLAHLARWNLCWSSGSSRDKKDGILRPSKYNQFYHCHSIDYRNVIHIDSGGRWSLSVGRVLVKFFILSQCFSLHSSNRSTDNGSCWYFEQLRFHIWCKYSRSYCKRLNRVPGRCGKWI